MKQVKKILILLLALVLTLGLATAASAADAVERYGFTLNDTWYENTGEGGAFVTADGVGLPEGVAFTVDGHNCVLTLSDAELGQTVFDGDYLPCVSLLIKLEGNNTITSKGTNALGICGGLTAAVISESNGSLTIQATNDAEKQKHEDGNVYTVSALDVYGATKFEVASGNVTVKVDGNITVSREQDGVTVTEEANLSAVNGDGSVNLVLSGGSLTLEGDQGIGQVGVLSIYDGTLTMPGGFVNCVYDQRGGTVNVTGVQTYKAMRENEMDYWVGLNFDQKAFNLSGGTLNIKVKNEKVEGGNAVWGSGLSVNGGRVNISGGTLNIEVASGEGVSLSSAFWNQTGGHVIVKNTNTEDPVGVSIGGYPEGQEDAWWDYSGLEISGGSLCVLGKLDVTGRLTVKEGGEISVGPCYDDAAQYGDGWHPSVYVDRRHNGPAMVEVTGGKLNVQAFSSAAPAMFLGGTFTQSGGTVELTGGTDGSALDLCGTATVQGGTLTASGDIGCQLYLDGDLLGRLTVLGGSMNLNGDLRGMIVLDGATVELKGGSLTAKGVVGASLASWTYETTENGDGSTTSSVSGILSKPSSVTVSGGEHTFENDRTQETEYGTYYGMALYSQYSDVSVTGGTLHLKSKQEAMDYYTVDPSDCLTLGSGIHAVSDETGTELQPVMCVQFYHDGIKQQSYCFNFQEDNKMTETEWGNYELDSAANVTISNAAGTEQAPGSTYAASLSLQSGQLTAGAPVTVAYHVAATGTVSVDLPEGMTLVAGSVSVDGEAVQSLENISVDGSVTIAFRAVPQAAGTYSITATATLADGSQRKETVSVTAGDFQISMPTMTKNLMVRANGVGTPDDTVTLKLISSVDTNNNWTTYTDKAFSGQVTGLGTFAVTISLPEVQTITTFHFEVYQGETKYADCSVTYYPPVGVIGVPPYPEKLTVTNPVHDEGDVTTVITFSDGIATPNRSFYTYWPGHQNFRFSAEVEEPGEGYEIVSVLVRVWYQDGTWEDVELDQDGTSTTWEGSKYLYKAPVAYQLIVNVRPVPQDPGKEETLVIETEQIPVQPIMDPSGTVYSWNLETVVPGAEATLYYGGNGTEPGTAVKFDMTPYGQVNPMMTDELGHYAWNVPEGWWKVVVTKDGKTVQSDWMHVLPVQTGVNLDLKLDRTEVVTPVTPVQKTETPLFSDVTKNQWYYDDVAYMVSQGLMKGIDSSNFAPNATLTRAMVVTMLYRVEGEPAVRTAGTFSDVAEGQWYTDAVEWAAREGIVEGYGSGKFGPNDPVTREQLAAILFRYAGGKVGAADWSAYKDADKISAYALDAMGWAVEKGILRGANQCLNPTGTATRAEAAAMFHRFLAQ